MASSLGLSGSPALDVIKSFVPRNRRTVSTGSEAGSPAVLMYRQKVEFSPAVLDEQIIVSHNLYDSVPRQCFLTLLSQPFPQTTSYLRLYAFEFGVQPLFFSVDSFLRKVSCRRFGGQGGLLCSNTSVTSNVLPGPLSNLLAGGWSLGRALRQENAPLTKDEVDFVAGGVRRWLLSHAEYCRVAGCAERWCDGAWP